MTTTYWDQLYGRPSISRDAVLFVVALALHLPLLLIHMDAPPKRGSSSYQRINVTYIETQMKHLRDRPVFNVIPQQQTFDLQGALGKMGTLKNHEAILPPPVSQISDLRPIRGMVTNPVIPPVSGEVLSVQKNGTLALETSGAKVSGPALGAGEAPKIDKGAFALKPEQVGSLAPPVSIAGARKVQPIIIPSGPETFGPPLIVSAKTSGRIAPVSPAPVAGPALPGVERGKTPLAIPSEPVVIKHVAAAPPVEIHPTASMERRMSGIPITGPLANRPVRYQEIPEYPEWARAMGIEAEIVLIFKVGPDGRVKNDVMVEKGSGEPRLDRHAIATVLRWIFEPLAESFGNREDVGTVTFKFSMK